MLDPLPMTVVPVEAQAQLARCCVRSLRKWDCLAGETVLPRTRVVLASAHLDHNPDNNRLRNLAALCQRCHPPPRFGGSVPGDVSVETSGYERTRDNTRAATPLCTWSWRP